MGTIAKNPVAALLAGAEINGGVFLGDVSDRCEIGAFVGAIAKRLGFALAA